MVQGIVSTQCGKINSNDLIFCTFATIDCADPHLAHLEHITYELRYFVSIIAFRLIFLRRLLALLIRFFSPIQKRKKSFCKNVCNSEVLQDDINNL